MTWWLQFLIWSVVVILIMCVGYVLGHWEGYEKGYREAIEAHKFWCPELQPKDKP